MDQLISYSREQILALATKRAGETKLAERVQLVTNQHSLALTTCKFVLVGLPEDVGVKANFGITGTRTAWEVTLKALMNIQSTAKLRGDELAVLGFVDFEDELKRARLLDPNNEDELVRLREIVAEIDKKVEPVIRLIYAAGKIPIVIGGGHNNCFPIIKAFSSSFNRPVNVINLDAHTDFRILEGRHSGNGFKYAFAGGFLNRYSVIGLQESYNSQNVLDELKSQPKHFQTTFYEDFVREDTHCSRSFQEALNFTDGLCGLEIDIDSIAGALSSAISPTGFSLHQVRDMIAQTRIRQLFYLHIAEGASRLDDGRESDQTGKLIACLITDFMKAQL